MASDKSDLLQGTLDMLVLKIVARESETGREAKFYSLTRLGRKQLDAETANWDRLASAVELIVRTAE
jgi:DNA-binding PadR family transcriptional regulator